MTGQDLLDLLAQGELANTGMCEKGKVRVERVPKVLGFINLGLTDLYSRFLLKEKTQVFDSIASNSYQIDDPECIEILKSQGRLFDGFYVNGNSLRMDTFVPNTKIAICYQANHFTLTEQNLDTPLELPISYVNALTLFVASKAYGSVVNQLDGDLNEGARYLARYYEELKTLEHLGIYNEILDNSTFFHTRGFV